MKDYIRIRATNKKSFYSIKTSDPIFLASDQAKLLKANKRNVFIQGYLLRDGALLVEQNNLRLKNTDHRFHLSVYTTNSNNTFTSRWRVESIYDFEPFSSKDYFTEIPLAEGFILKVPDGLSHYLTTIGVAQDFDYFAEWTEMWR